MSRVIVIGGGAAGMMAAAAAGRQGHEVLLMEQNEKLGKKVYITGKGRCNFTNACDTEQLFAAVISNAKFLYSAFYTFDNQAVMDYFLSEGMKYKIERGNRVFPTSDHASDVIRTLERTLRKERVKILLDTEVTGIDVSGGRVTGVAARCAGKEKRYPCDAVILATGGCSYPLTGSTGDGIRWAGEMGHGITKPQPALVPLVTEETYIPQMQGLSLKNVELTILDRRGKRCFREFGEMLFTHFGVSGPLVLSASSVVGRRLRDEGSLRAYIDLKPALGEKQLDERLLREFGEHANKQFSNVLRHLLPAKMIPVLPGLSGIPADRPVRDITREERGKLVDLLKHFPFTVIGARGFNEAIITQGGVSVRDVNPSTMESKKVHGLYFAGEMLDLDAVTGGYNLQIAWSTGHLAGSSVPRAEDAENQISEKWER